MAKKQNLTVTPSSNQAIQLSVEGQPRTVSLKIDQSTGTDWLSTVDDALKNRIVKEKYDGFELIKPYSNYVGEPSAEDKKSVPEETYSTLGGRKIQEGDIIQVQFPKGEVVQLQVAVNRRGYAIHRSWWSGVAVEVLLNGLPARSVSF